MSWIPSILSIGLAGFLAYKGNPYWGWFLFAAIMTASAAADSFHLLS